MDREYGVTRLLDPEGEFLEFKITCKFGGLDWTFYVNPNHLRNRALLELKHLSFWQIKLFSFAKNKSQSSLISLAVISIFGDGVDLAWARQIRGWGVSAILALKTSKKGGPMLDTNLRLQLPKYFYHT